jgi:hypothetical protein
MISQVPLENIAFFGSSYVATMQANQAPILIQLVVGQKYLTLRSLQSHSWSLKCQRIKQLFLPLFWEMDWDQILYSPLYWSSTYDSPGVPLEPSSLLMNTAFGRSKEMAPAACCIKAIGCELAVDKFREDIPRRTAFECPQWWPRSSSPLA